MRTLHSHNECIFFQSIFSSFLRSKFRFCFVLSCCVHLCTEIGRMEAHEKLCDFTFLQTTTEIVMRRESIYIFLG